jgi:hypothetical protein
MADYDYKNGGFVNEAEAKQYRKDLNMKEFIMTPDELDDGSCVINFDQQDDGSIVNTGGYVMVSQDDTGFIITAIDGQGNVVNQYMMPYHVAYNGDEEHV